LGIKSLYPECDIRLEVPFSFETKGRIDILARFNDDVYPLELMKSEDDIVRYDIAKAKKSPSLADYLDKIQNPIQYFFGWGFE